MTTKYKFKVVTSSNGAKVITLFPGANTLEGAVKKAERWIRQGKACAIEIVTSEMVPVKEVQ